MYNIFSLKSYSVLPDASEYTSYIKSSSDHKVHLASDYDESKSTSCRKQRNKVKRRTEDMHTNNKHKRKDTVSKDKSTNTEKNCTV